MTTLTELDGPAGDPGAAQDASREARRRVRTSQGIYLLGVGLLLTVFGGGWVLAGRPPDWLQCIAILLGGAFSLALPLAVRRSRARRGVYVVPKGELVRDNDGRVRVPTPVKIAFGAGLVLTLGTALLLTQMKSDLWSDDRRITGLILAVSGLSFLGSFARFRLWEELLLAGGFAAAGTLAALGAAWGWSFLVLGAVALFAGLSYQVRWTRWVRRLEQA